MPIIFHQTCKFEDGFFSVIGSEYGIVLGILSAFSEKTLLWTLQRQLPLTNKKLHYDQIIGKS